MQKLADLIASLKDATLSKRLAWVRQDSGGYRADLAGGQVQLSGDPTPAALEEYLRASSVWFTVSYLGRLLGELPKVALPKGQPQPNWPSRRLTLTNSDGKIVLCFEADREHPWYPSLALLFLEAFAVAEVEPASAVIESMLGELNQKVKPATPTPPTQSPSLTPQLPPSYGDLLGSIDDETFTIHPQPPLPPPVVVE